MRWGGGWSNVHSFDITTGRTVNTNSEDIVWSSITGIIDGAPIWGAAKIMHYQCGSMEDFIARSRRRQDIKVTAAQWSEHDKNDIHDTDPRKKILDVRRWMGIAFLWTIRRIAVDLKIMTPHIEYEKINSNNEGCQYYPETLNIFAIKTAFGNFLEVLDNGFVRQTASPDLISTSNPLLGIEIGNSKKLALFSAKDLCVPYIVDDPRVSSFLAYDIYSLPDKGKIALRHPSTNYFLSVEPISAGGNVQANRNMVKGWEEFSLAPLEDYHNYTDKDVARILSLVAEKMHENWSMADLRKNQVPNSREGAIILEALIEFMDNDDRAVIQSRLQGASNLII